MIQFRRPIVSRSIFATLLGLALLAGASPAAACTPITSLPYTITSPGQYCLTGNLWTGQTNGDAITVDANYVTLDLGGYDLSGSGIASSTAYGIHAYAQTDVTVRNGNVRGFLVGVGLEGQLNPLTSKNHIVEDLRILNCFSVGIRVYGQNNVVRRNQLIGIGGSTATGTSSVVAIGAYGTRNVVERNEVLGWATGAAAAYYGVMLNPSSNTLVEGNRIVEATTAIYISYSAAVNVVGNRIWQGSYGVDYIGSTGKYRDNLTVGVATPFFGGTDAGNNN